jgi:hypothetical protein
LFLCFQRSSIPGVCYFVEFSINIHSVPFSVFVSSSVDQDVHGLSTIQGETFILFYRVLRPVAVGVKITA